MGALVAEGGAAGPALIPLGEVDREALASRTGTHAALAAGVRELRVVDELRARYPELAIAVDPAIGEQAGVIAAIASAIAR